MAARYICGDEGRRAAVRGSPLNGIDFIEVLPDQRTLRIHFLNPPAPANLTPENIIIEGGARITNIQAQAVNLDPLDDAVLVVTVNVAGDFSNYTLRLVDVGAFDPRLAAISFSFKINCPSEFDCLTEPACPPVTLDEPVIDYLAKDYASFRRLILDRLSIIAPHWQTHNPADLGVVLVELLAYVGDQLSYFQDAVGTEAYLGTARKRISVRRHARLVDYTMGEGVNARVWVTFQVNSTVELPGPSGAMGRPGTLLLTRYRSEEPLLPPESIAEAIAVGAIFFETMHPATLRADHNRIRFYTWSDRECCLPTGATAATLLGPLPDLAVNDLILFEEVLGSKTGSAEDADPTHRHVVRLTDVQADEDPLDGTPVVNIAWRPADALPFPLCLSARTEAEHGAQFIEDVSLACGNVVLADHGLTLRVAGGINPLQPLADLFDPVPDNRPFRPPLAHGPLTHAVPLPEDHRQQPAGELLRFEAREAVPAIRLVEGDDEDPWTPQRDLLASGRFAREFVAEIEEDGRARLRFGDNTHGQQPGAGSTFTASYRVGQGLVGNIGAETLGHLIPDPTSGIDLSSISQVRNPLPAQGGQEPESMDEVRQFAPQAFRVQQRAVTEADYAAVAERHPEVQRAAATFRWTGSWYTVFVTVDRLGGLPVDPEFVSRLRDYLNFYRMAGYDLEVNGPQFVSLDLILGVCVKPGYFRSEVKAALLEQLSNRRLSNGQRGFFHPDNWTFGQPVYLSRIFAAAGDVTGVESVTVTRFQRWDQTSSQALRTGILPLGHLEIARLDNDPNFPENGVLSLVMQGGL